MCFIKRRWDSCLARSHLTAIPRFVFSDFIACKQKRSSLSSLAQPTKRWIQINNLSKIKCSLDKSQSALYKEEVGFEPTVRVNVRQFSRLLQSTALALLQSIGYETILSHKSFLSRYTAQSIYKSF